MKNLFCSFVLAVSAFTVSAQDASRLADADNNFAFDLFKQIAAAGPGNNLFISPLSVSSALQMMANGAAGDTRTEMDRALKTTGLPPQTLDAACKELMQSLNSETNATLTLANGIWYQNVFRLKPGFIAANKDFFGAELAAVDFQDPSAAKTINDWADAKTRGKVQNVVQFPFPPLTKVVLANAIYFKGKWAEPFDRGRTEKADFHPEGSGVKKVMTMSEQRDFIYSENDVFQAVRLAYAGNRLDMYLFLPSTNFAPRQLVDGFVGDGWKTAISRFTTRKGLLEFPRFKMDYEIALNSPLQALGIKQAFDPGSADFSAMADERISISEVKQKSYVAVDEEGTEAAAVTTGMMRANSIQMNQPPPFRMIVDRPFFFVIADRQTQAILFMGIVSDPAK